MINRRSANLLKALVLFAAMSSTGRAVLVENGLILNLQADNINGANNAGMTANQEVEAWVDVVVGGGSQTQDNATGAGGKAYLDANSTKTGTPNYVAVTTTGRPGVQFTRDGSDGGDVLGVNAALTNFNVGTLDFTVFVVADLNSTSAQRMLQIGRENGANRRIVGFGNQGFRFNGGAKNYGQNLGSLSAGAHIATYSMDMTASIANASFRIDGTEGTGASTTFFTTNPPGGENTLLNVSGFNEGYAVGAGQSNASALIDPLEGIIYAMLVYNRVLDASEVTEVETFLYEKFIAVPEASSWAALSLAAAAYGVVWQVRRRSQS